MESIEQPHRKILFAPLIRVSTEQAGRKGESLRTQKAQLSHAIEALGGKVYHWYEGQEHATPEYERRILEQLMADAQARKFDAVMVADISRWSRDNGKSKNYIEILKESGIRFFTGTREVDLFKPNEGFIIGIGVEVAEFVAWEQAYKSIINRINRAKRGWPTCGKLPYGRTWCKATGTWAIDGEKQAKVQKIARLYLTGDYSWEQLGKMFGMAPPALGKILCHRCGDEWEQRFISKRCNIDETVITRVPRLLPEETILAFRKKAEERNSWDKKGQKHQYLFARLVFDAETNRVLIGTCNKVGNRYYRPYQGTPNRYRVNADVLEKAVLEELFTALGSKASLHNAVFDGHPLGKVADKIGEDLQTKRDELKSVETQIENYLTAIGASKDVVALLDRIKPKLAECEARSAALKDEIAALEFRLASIPEEAEIEARREMWRSLLARQLPDPEQLKARQTVSYLQSGAALEDLPFEHRKKIIRLFFGGRDEAGRRYGIYIKDLGGNPRTYRFEAHGKLGAIQGKIESKTGEYFSHSYELWLRDDKELGKGISRVLVDGNPWVSGDDSKAKVHLLGPDEGLAPS
jgi:DNA invertase Pin-like site-specific DNA recombinase